MRYVFIGSWKEKEVFKKFYEDLRCILPIRNISDQLVSKKIISIGDKEEITAIKGLQDKASFVLEIIGNSLKAGITHSFYDLLSIMDEYGGDVSHFTKKVRKELDEFSGTYIHKYILYKALYELWRYT